MVAVPILDSRQSDIWRSIPDPLPFLTATGVERCRQRARRVGYPGSAEPTDLGVEVSPCTWAGSRSSSAPRRH
jgi:hypothetical protein